jgi:hypothetical protein
MVNPGQAVFFVGSCSCGPVQVRFAVARKASGLASTFGWTPCSCGATDGTVSCAHKQAGQMIAEAQAYLDEHIGDEVEDPGYFGDNQ